MVVLSLALIATAGVLVFGTARMRREPLAEADAAAATVVVPSSAVSSSAVPSSSSSNRDQGLSTLAAVQSETKKVAAALAGPPASPGARDDVRPAFDVARIEPSGDAVIAGRATPGASVELLRNGELHDRVVADASGQFAMVPPRLPPGDYELTLRSRQPDGKPATSRESVVVALQPNLKERPVVALMSPDKPSVVLSKPASPNSAGGTLAVETVEAEPSGKLYVSGRSPPRAAVRLYLNDNYTASTTSATDGRFAFTVGSGVEPGGYRVRVDEVETTSNAIRSRAEVPFTMPGSVAASVSGLNNTVGSSKSSPTSAPQGSQNPRQAEKPQDAVGTAAPRELASVSASSAGTPAAATAPKMTTTVVSRGDSLWRISRAAYGDGARYTVIYGANHSQIRNPDRIYPGQVLVLPEPTR